MTAERQYDAFGNVIASSGAWKSQFGNAGRFGYQEDPDSGLKLLGHRYYDSSTGRFLTRGPIKDGRNWYAYCENRVVDHFDSNGLQSLPVNPSGLPPGWKQGPHGGSDGWRNEGGQGRYYSPGVDPLARDAGPGLEFHPESRKGGSLGPDPHWHPVDENGKKDKNHLRPGDPYPPGLNPQQPGENLSNGEDSVPTPEAPPAEAFGAKPMFNPGGLGSRDPFWKRPGFTTALAWGIGLFVAAIIVIVIAPAVLPLVLGGGALKAGAGIAGAVIVIGIGNGLRSRESPG